MSVLGCQFNRLNSSGILPGTSENGQNTTFSSIGNGPEGPSLGKTVMPLSSRQPDEPQEAGAEEPEGWGDGDYGGFTVCSNNEFPGSISCT